MLLRDLVEAGFFKALTADDIAVLFSLRHSDSCKSAIVWLIFNQQFQRGQFSDYEINA